MRRRGDLDRRNLMPLEPTDTVICERYSATLSAGACARRHRAVVMSGNAKGSDHRLEFFRCVRCCIGEARALELEAGGWIARPIANFLVDRSAAFVAWRRRAYAVGLGTEPPTIDGLPKPNF